MLHVENGRIVKAGLAAGGVAPLPWRLTRSEAVLVGRAPDAQAIAAASEMAVEYARPLAHNEFKIALLRNAVDPRLANDQRPAMSTHSALRYEAALKVTGSAVYEGEVPKAGMLHAALVEAPISCGDVLSVDATQAMTCRASPRRSPMRI